MSGDRGLVGGGIASLRGPVGGACDRIESSSGSCQTGRNLGFHHPLRSPVSNKSPMPTATTTASAGVDSQLEVVERKVPLELDRVDYTVLNPAALTARLTDPLQYAQRVEIIVTGLGIEHLLPRHDERIARFLDIWIEDETTHGVALGTLLDQLGLETYVPTDASLPIHNQLAKLLGRLSQRAHEVVELIWSASGAMNEHLAMSAYREMGIVVDELGERSLYETLFKRLRTHEAAHKGFYAAYAREVAQGMHWWQRRLARAIIVHTYAPVGAGARVDKPALGAHGSGPRPRRWLGGEGGRPGPADRREAAGRRRTPAEVRRATPWPSASRASEARPHSSSSGAAPPGGLRSVRRSLSGGRLVG